MVVVLFRFQISAVALITVLLACTCATPRNGDVEGEIFEYDVSDMAGDPNMIFSFDIVGTWSPPVVRRWSNRTDDVDCKHDSERSYTWRNRSSLPLHLSRRASPETALYEWHLCFEVDGRMYRGWRGFDPGPGSLVELECHVDTSQPPSDLYACKTNNLKINLENYGEAAYSCRAGEPCRRFDSQEEYSAWRALPAFTFEDAIEAASALIRYDLLHADSYLAANPGYFYVDVDEHDLPRGIAESLSTESHHFYPASDLDPRYFDTEADVDDQSKSTMSIGEFIRRGDGTMEVSYSFYCGPLCASGNTAVLKRDEAGEWVVVSSKMHWIS